MREADQQRLSESLQIAQAAIVQAQQLQEQINNEPPREDITERYSETIRWWAKAISKRQSADREHIRLWSGFEMGFAEALFRLSMDLGWSLAELEALEAVATKQAEAELRKENNDRAQQ